MAGLLEYIIGPGKQPERRAGNLENPAVSLQDADAWAESFGWGTESTSGEVISPKSAMSVSAFWQAVGLIGGDCSKIPVRTMRKRKPKENRRHLRPIRDDSHYLNDKIGLYGQPNDDISGHKLWRRAFVDALVWNNSYIWLDWQGTRIANLVNLLPDRTTVVRKFGKLWVVTEVGVDETGKGRLVARPYEEVLHLEGICLDHLVACETIQAAREDLGNALAARNFKSRFFGQGMHAGGVLQAPMGAPAPAIEKMEDAIEKQHSTTNRAFRTIVMRDGFKYHATQVNASEAQLTEQEDAAVRDIARRFLLSPSRLGLRDSVSYNSLSQDRIDYHDSTLAWWLICQLSELNTKALTRPERKNWELRHDQNLALQYADATTLATIATQGVTGKWLGRQEARDWFNLPPDEEDEKQEGPTDANGPEDTTPPPPPALGDDNDPPPAGEGNPGTQARAHHGLLAAETGRLLRRLNTHARRALTKSDTDPAALGTWLAEGMEKQLAKAAEQLTPAWTACRSVALNTADLTADHLVAELAARYRQAARDAKGPLTAQQTNDLANDLAAQFIGADHV